MPSILAPEWSSAIVPSVELEIDWSHPLAYGLHHVNVLNVPRGNNILYSKTAGPATFISLTPGFSVGPGGSGISNTGGSTSSCMVWYNGQGSPLWTAGSCFCYCTMGVSIAATAYWLLEIVNVLNSPTSQFDIVRYSDGKWYVGWYPAAEQRIVVTDTFWVDNLTSVIGATIVAGTGSAGNTDFWINGIKRGNRNGTTSPPTPTNYCHTVGGVYRSNSPAPNMSWLSAVNARVYWVAYWDRVLNDSEIVYLNSNPMCFLSPLKSEVPSLYYYMSVRQRHFRFRIDTDAVDATPIWGAAEDVGQ